MRYSSLKSLIVIIAVASYLGGATPICLAHEDHAPLPTKGVTIAGDKVLLSDNAREAIGLTTEKVELADLHRTIEVNAWVELPWDRQARIASLVPCKIEQVLVRPGEAVAAGQELVRVQSIELESLQLVMLRAKSELELAERLVEKKRALEAQGVIAGKTIMEVEADLTRKTLELYIAVEKLRALGIDEETLTRIRTSGEPLRTLPITSPIKGMITHADVRVGQVVGTADHLYHVVDSSHVWIVCEVLESDVRHLEKGQPVTASFGAYQGKQFRGVIDHIRLKMDRRTRTQEVVVAVDNPDGLLRGGMYGRAGIIVRVAKEAIVCPVDAIIKSRSGQYVLLQRGLGKFENRKVTLGLVEGKRIEVLEGLFPGDRVVVVGAYLLASLLGNEHKARVSGDSTASENVDENVAAKNLPIMIINATVELPTDRQSYAGTQIDGSVLRVRVKPSEYVEAGQILAEVNSLKLRAIQLDLLLALSHLRYTETLLKLTESLGADGIISMRRVWELQKQRDTLRHQVVSLKQQLAFFGLSSQTIAKLEQLDLSRAGDKETPLPGAPIRAPSAGWIVGFHVMVGQVVGPKEQLFEIHSHSKVWVKGYVFERDAARVTVGQPTRVTFSAFPKREEIGRIVRISPMMDGNERVLPIWIEIDNSDLLLKEGMLARVHILAQATIADSDIPPKAAGTR